MPEYGWKTIRIMKIAIEGKENKAIDLIKMKGAIIAYSVNKKDDLISGFTKKTSIQEEKYLETFFMKKEKKKYNTLDANNNQVKETYEPGEVTPIYIFDSGFVVFETTNLIRGSEVIQCLSDAWSKYENSKVIVKEIKFSNSIFRSLYKDFDIVNRISLANIGEMKPNPHPGPKIIESITRAYGEEVNTTTATAKKNGNLKKAQLVDQGFERYSRMTEIQGKIGKLYYSIRKSGRISLEAPDALDERKEKFLSFAKKFIKMFNEEKEVGI